MEPQQKPVMLVTTASNKGNLCAIEIANRIMISDPRVRIVEVVPNVLLVYSELESQLSYGLVISAPPACAKKIFPVHATVRPDYGEIVSEAKRLLDEINPKTLYVECYSRGGKMSCRTLEMAVGGVMSEKAKIDSRAPEVRCVINVLEDIVLISVIRGSRGKLSVKSLP